MEIGIYDGCGIIHQKPFKHSMVQNLEEVVNCLVVQSDKYVECMKNRFGNRNIEGVKDIEFDKLNLSDLNGTIPEIRNKYHGKNIWLMIEN